MGRKPVKLSGPTVGDAMQARIEELILQYIEDLRKPEQTILQFLQETNSRQMVGLIKRENQGRELGRMKDTMLRPCVDRVYDRLRDEERTRIALEDNENEEDDEDRDDLVEVKDTNQMNKSVVGLWNVSSAGNTESAITTDNEDTANGKKREREETDDKSGATAKEKRKIKKQKGKKVSAEDRTPTSSITLAELGGIDDVISQVLDVVVMPMAKSEIYEHIGTDIPRGVLLHGPPGCGKTMLANAIANALKVPFISISAPSVVSGMSGESEKKLREIFEEAKTLAPCLLFIDEIDAITPKRESAQREMERRIVAQLLTCMDSMSLEQTGGNPVMIIGATNRPDSIDPALRRGGRFDAEIAMTVPDQLSREKILRTIASKLRLEGDFDFKKLAKSTPGYVAADLQALVSAAGARAIKRIFRELPVNEQMDVDDDNADSASQQPADAVTKFLTNHPDPLTAEQLEPLAVSFSDFMEALPTIQPSSKREGFTTVPDVNWNDVGAMKDIRDELDFTIVKPIQEPEMFNDLGISGHSGVLLWGPPGCGKTLIAKAVANESQANFISVRGPELLNKFVGESERAVRQVFVRARASVPCVIFFDELDALVPRRDDVNSEASSRVVNTLLTELDGVGDRTGIYVIGATNRRDMVDPAMIRPGRLDKQLFVELPNAEERVEILKTVTRSSPLDPSVDLVSVAHDERARNFSGADLQSLSKEATVCALKKALLLKRENPQTVSDRVTVSTSDFEQAFSKIKPSVSDSERLKYKLMNEQDQD